MGGRPPRSMLGSCRRSIAGIGPRGYRAGGPYRRIASAPRGGGCIAEYAARSSIESNSARDHPEGV